MIEIMIGVMGSGKDTRCNKLVESSYTKLGFADGVRDVAWTALGWKPKTPEEYEDFKNNYIRIQQDHMHLVGDAYMSEIYDINSITGRQFLINIGDGFRAYFGNDIWVNGLITKIKRTPNTKFCISDCRYPNEALELYEKFLKVRYTFCNFKSQRYKADPSIRSEWMACQLINLGYKDGDEIKDINLFYDLNTIFNKLNETRPEIFQN